MRSLRLITPPSDEPLMVSDVVTWTQDNGGKVAEVYKTTISRRRHTVESKLRIALLTQTWELTLDENDAKSAILIPRPPLQSITSVKTISGSTGAETTVSSSLYRVVTANPPHLGKIILLDGQTWGSDIATDAGMVITFVAGYGDNPSDIEDVAPSLFTGLLELMEFSRVHRGAGVMGGQRDPERMDTPREVRRILSEMIHFEAVRGE
ncbi:hypothetical protein N9X87_00545 [bacterium]|nr:hypothetical protein [bacterium]